MICTAKQLADQAKAFEGVTPEDLQWIIVMLLCVWESKAHP